MATPRPAIDRTGGAALPRAGTLLAGRWRLDAPLARAAGCFEASDRRSGARAFVKTGPQERLEREAELLSALDHPGIVRLQQFERAGASSFVVLGWTEGVDLETALRRREPLSDDALVRLLGRLADAVAAIHAAGWLHRDLKPANVVVRPDGAPVIVDLGAALPIDGATGRETELTDGYGAPEQYLADALEGPWTDVYGLGAIGYRALWGRPPVPAPARLRGEAMALAIELAGQHAETLCRAIDWALALEVAARPRTAPDWSAALGTSVEEAGAPAPDAPGPVSVPLPALDDYPPTVRVRRAPRAQVAGPAAAAPGRPVPASRRRRAGVVAAALLLALATGIAGAAWYARPLYERYVKTDWLVDPNGGGDAHAIAEAIARAGAGATIRVAPGTYAESLTIDRALHLVPAVPSDPPVIAPGEGACVVARGAGGSISGLRFAGAKGDDPEAAAPCLLLAHSDLRLEGNRIAGGAGAAILIRDGGGAQVTGNVIEGGHGPGIVVTAGAVPQIARNRLAGLAGPALIVRGGAEPAIRDNSFEDSGALVFAEGAAGRLEGNRITASRASGIEVTSGADPAVVENTIERAGGAGIFVYDHGTARIERSVIVGSRLSGVVVASGGAAHLSGNAIRESAEHGVLIVEGGRAMLEGNAIEGSKGNGIVVGRDGEAELADNALAGNAEPQLLDARAP